MAEAAQNSIRPAIRHVDVHRVEQDGQRGVVLDDPLGITPEQVFIPEGLLPLLSRFDGVRTAAEIEAEFQGQLPPGFVANLVSQLDDHLLLVGPRFDAAFGQTVDQFTCRTLRPARHAGTAGYPATARACHKALERIVQTTEPGQQACPRGLIAPHIDLQRGAAGYRAAYQSLSQSEPAELYVIFGTGHQGPAAAVTGLAMDWDTPLGRVATDHEFIAGVHARLGTADPRDIFLHEREHSLEFQVLFLRHVLGDQPFEVAAFLTGSLPAGTADPLADAACRRILDAFRAQAAASGKRICFIAGADLAHLGPFFGDSEPIDPQRLERLERDERAHLSHLERGDAGTFYRAVEATGNPDRVCGTAPIFLTAALAGGPGESLHYGQAAAEDGSQVVSFCSFRFAGE